MNTRLCSAAGYLYSTVQPEGSELPSGIPPMQRVFMRNIHALDQTVADATDMIDDCVENLVAFEVLHHLVNGNDPTITFIQFDSLRFNVRIENRPLFSPISPDRIATMNVSTL